MIRTIAKLKAPWWGGKATVQFVKSFRRMKPEHRKSFISQAMKDLRSEYDLACEHARINAIHEDARNAEAATLRAETATS